jgi:hypothetical protein
MARIPGVRKGEESWILRLANRYSRKRLGAAVEPAQIVGHQPWLLAGIGGYEMASERLGSVPARLKSLADIKAAMLIGCPF